MANTYLINDNKRKKLREQTIDGAFKYLNYLVEKDFFVLCEDGTEYILHF